MARRQNTTIRAVKDGETRSPARRFTVSEAAELGDHRELLVAMRARIAKAVADPNCPPRDLAALTRRLQDIAKEIEALDAAARQEEAEGAAVADEEFSSEAL